MAKIFSFAASAASSLVAEEGYHDSPIDTATVSSNTGGGTGCLQSGDGVGYGSFGA